MRKATALVVGTLLALLGLSGTGQAQSSIQLQGTIQAVDCGAQTVVLAAPGTSNTVAAATYTAVLVNSTSVPFCALTRYVGAPATAWLVATGNEFVATRIDVVGQVAVAPVYPVAPAATVVEPLPIEGIILGTIIVAGLLFLLARDRDDDDHFYRYPYYGKYYHYYYRPEYRPYLGPYPAETPVITIPQRVGGSVLGTTEVSGLQYLVVRERTGELSRYPYYGPYHRYYYRPEYRRYRGPHPDAPVRQGDVRWDTPANGDWHGQQGSPQFRGIGPLPVRQGDPRMIPPALPPAYRNGNNNQDDQQSHGIGAPLPMRQSDPRWGAPPHQNDPAVRRPDWNRPVFQNGRGQDAPRRDAPRYRQPTGRCNGSNQQCSDREPISPTR